MSQPGAGRGRERSLWRRKKTDGTQIFQGYARGSESQWARIWAGKAPGGSSYDFFRYSVFQDPNFKNTGFDYDKDTDRALSAKVVGKETVADVYNVKPDLTRFNAMGHKLIMYHGWADQQISLCPMPALISISRSRPSWAKPRLTRF